MGSDAENKDRVALANKYTTDLVSRLRSDFADSVNAEKGRSGRLRSSLEGAKGSQEMLKSTVRLLLPYSSVRNEDLYHLLFATDSFLGADDLFALIESKNMFTRSANPAFFKTRDGSLESLRSVLTKLLAERAGKEDAEALRSGRRSLEILKMVTNKLMANSTLDETLEEYRKQAVEVSQ